LIDKRHAYEESIRVPMLAWAPGWIQPGSRVDDLVRNIDIAPTLLELAGTESNIEMDGSSALEILRNASPPVEGEAPVPEGREFLYEYYWEHAFPHTPTTFALRNEQYKFIYYHGIWDTEELYDMQNDPEEKYNLALVPSMQTMV